MIQNQQNPRIDSAELKARLVKKIGSEKSKRYFYYLNKFLNQKLSKCEFNKLCNLVIGRDNLPLHNLFILSILKNGCNAKTPPPLLIEVGSATKSAIQKGHEKSGAHGGIQIPKATTRSNGVVFPISPKKARSSRKFNERSSPLWQNGKTHKEDNIVVENGGFASCGYIRSTNQMQGLSNQHENQKKLSIQQSLERPSTEKTFNGEVSVFSKDCREEMEQAKDTNTPIPPLIAPLGIPFCPASVGGSRKALPVTSSDKYVSYCDKGDLFGPETLRHCMEQIASAQDLEGVSSECANILNNMMELHLKKLINSCVQMVGSRSENEQISQKQQIQHKLANGTCPSNLLHVKSSNGLTSRSISLLDFKVAMELNPQQLGEDWPLLMEKICTRTFEK